MTIIKVKIDNNCIYFCEDINVVTEPFIYEYKDRMSDEKLNRILNIKNEKVRKQSFLAYVLLSEILIKEYNYKETLDFEYSENGKPFLRGNTDFNFSVSHSDNVVGCAVSKNPIGFDLQTIVGFDKIVMKRVCTDEQLDEINRTENPDQEFIKLWTQKESIIKLNGDGVGALKTADPNDYSIFTNKVNNYYYSVCNLK